MIRGTFWLLAITFIGFWHWGPDYWWSKWVVLLAFVIVDISIYIIQKFALSAGLCFLYTALSSLWILAWRKNYTAELSDIDATSLTFYSAYALGSFLLLVWVVSLWDSSTFKKVRSGFAIACVCDSLWVLFELYSNGFKRNHQGGFFDTGPVNGTFIACALPFFLESSGVSSLVKKFALSVVAMALLANAIVDHGSNVVGVVLVVLVVLVLFDSSFQKTIKRRIVYSCILVVSVMVLFTFLDNELFSSSGRFEMYRRVFDWFIEKPKAYLLFGMGNGSFAFFGPGLKGVNWADRNGLFPWLHSDPLQTFFELGLVGASLWLWFLIDCFRFAYNSGDRNLVAAFLGVLASTVFQYPVHLPLSALLMASIFGACLNCRARNNGPT